MIRLKLSNYTGIHLTPSGDYLGTYECTELIEYPIR
jgi:hypothetical protein